MAAPFDPLTYNVGITDFGRRLAAAANKAQIEQHAREVEAVIAMLARRETPPVWLVGKVRNAPPGWQPPAELRALLDDSPMTHPRN